MDVIEDTQLAINSYLDLQEFNSNNNGYLYIYGIMQALNIQQDAANNLLNALFNRSIDFKTEFPQLYEIREHRNNSIGHPTKRGNDNSFHFIGRNSISKKGFTLSSYFPKTGERSKYEEVNILSCIQIQKGLVDNLLKETMEKLQSDFEKHKLKFKGIKLSDLIRDSFHYEFTKLYENIDRDYPLSEMNFNIIYDAYEKIKSGVIERYFSVEALPGVFDIVRFLDYIFARLRRDLLQNKIDDKVELYIFIDSLKAYFGELEGMLADIDEEFG